MLATLWTTMLMALVIKKTGSIGTGERENVAKFAIALVVSIVSGITSFENLYLSKSVKKIGKNVLGSYDVLIDNLYKLTAEELVERANLFEINI